MRKRKTETKIRHKVEKIDQKISMILTLVLASIVVSLVSIYNITYAEASQWAEPQQAAAGIQLDHRFIYPLVLTSPGKVHIIYNGDGNKLCWVSKIDGTWNLPVIVALDVEYQGFCFFDAKLDSNNNVHMVYRSIFGSLNYATNSSGSWIIESIELTGGAESASFATGSDGSIHLVFVRLDKLYYLKREVSGIWTTPLQIPGSNIASASIDLDSSEYAHVVFDTHWTGTGYEAYYMNNGSGSWSVPQVIGPGPDGNYSEEFPIVDVGRPNEAINVMLTRPDGLHFDDPSGRTAFGNHSIYSVRKSASGWTEMEFIFLGILGIRGEFVYDSLGGMHFVHCANYRTKTSTGEWKDFEVFPDLNETKSVQEQVGFYPSVHVDSLGVVHVAYSAKGNSSTEIWYRKKLSTNPPNNTPMLDSIGNKSIDEGSLLEFQVSATDLDGDPITYSVQDLPDGATFQNQTFTWTPTASDVGDHQLTFIASDGSLSDSEEIVITVRLDEEITLKIRFNTNKVSKIGILYISGETNEGALIEEIKLLDECNKILDIDIKNNVSINGEGNIAGEVLVKDIVEKYPLVTGIKIRVKVREGDETAEGETEVARIEPYREGPDKIELKCYNNVFNPIKGEEAVIKVELNEGGRIKLNLYNARGEKIKELADEEKDAEIYKYYWDGKDNSGNVVGSGVYFVHIQAGDYKKTKKIVVVK